MRVPPKALRVPIRSPWNVTPNLLLETRRGHDSTKSFPRQESTSVPVLDRTAVWVNSFTLQNLSEYLTYSEKSSSSITVRGSHGLAQKIASALRLSLISERDIAAWIKRVYTWRESSPVATLCVCEVLMPDCLFCNIVEGKVRSAKVFEDDRTYAFEDNKPQAPTHVLVAPKKHISGLQDAEPGDAELIGHCYLVAGQIAHERNIEDSLRAVFNVGPRAGQAVSHLHIHVPGGRDMKWPLG